MPLDDRQRELIRDFRDTLEADVSRDVGLPAPERDDRGDESTLASRWPAENNVWYELAIRPFLPQVRVGICTTDRWRNEDMEQLIEDSGETMQEFVELGFASSGLDWPEPPVEHYRDHGRRFYFATPLDLETLDQLADEAVREKTRRMLTGYHRAFTGAAR